MTRRGRPRSPNPSKGALRARRHYARMNGRDPVACSWVEVDGRVISMLVRCGLLPDGIPTNGEVRQALSTWLREQADSF